MTKPRKPYTNRSSWTRQQIAIVERYMEDANRRRIYARWDLYEEEIGHPVSSIRSMAHYIRNRRRDAESRRLRHHLRALANAPPPCQPAVAVPVCRGKPPAVKPAAAAFEIDSHRISTTTGRLKLDAELRDRIGIQGLTAGWFGDPPPGRSAPDEKRAGIVRPAAPVRGKHIPARRPTLATRIAR